MSKDMNPAPQTHSRVDVEEEIASVVQSVNEWDDRTSPDDYPEHLLITSEELSDVLRNFAAAISLKEEPTPVAWQPRYKQEVIDHLRTVSSNVSEYAMTVFATKDEAEGYGHGGHEVRPLYTSPAPQPREAGSDDP